MFCFGVPSEVSPYPRMDMGKLGNCGIVGMSLTHCCLWYSVLGVTDVPFISARVPDVWGLWMHVLSMFLSVVLLYPGCHQDLCLGQS
jgi:hypothetical protein